MAFTSRVVEVATGKEHALPADTATRDAPTLARVSSAAGPVVPVVLRPAEEAFYVCGERWPELRGRLVRRGAWNAPRLEETE